MISDSRRSPRRQKTSLKTTLVVIGLLVGYSLLQPRLEQWLGVDLPALTDHPQEVSAPGERSSREDRTAPSSGDLSVIVPATKAAGTSDPAVAGPSTAEDRSSPTSTANDVPPSERGDNPSRRLGELRDVGSKVFQSTAGLRYRPGSQEGHRIKHILRHHEDDPDRPVHGVFDGDRNEVFAVIDEAYLYTFDHGPPRVTKEADDGRTVYVVDLGRRIGYVGGQKGRRDGRPAANHLQLILEGTNVVTAYPVRVGRRP